MVEPEFRRLLSENRIYFGKDGNAQSSVIRYLNEVEEFVPWTWWPHEEVGHTDEARKEIQSLFGTQNAFDTPKPTRISERILQIATNPGDLVLDSFGGSGTTAHAAIKINAAPPNASPPTGSPSGKRPAKSAPHEKAARSRIPHSHDLQPKGA